MSPPERTCAAPLILRGRPCFCARAVSLTLLCARPGTRRQRWTAVKEPHLQGRQVHGLRQPETSEAACQGDAVPPTSPSCGLQGPFPFYASGWYS
jgi:hypothetical protein